MSDSEIRIGTPVLSASKAYSTAASGNNLDSGTLVAGRVCRGTVGQGDGHI